MSERVRIGIAEAIGTMILIIGGPGTAILATGHFTGTMNSVGILGVALAFGLSLLVAAYAIGSISGCHINPAVTLGLWVIGKTKSAELPFYLVGQFVGGIVGALVIFVIASATRVASATATNLGTFSAKTTGFASNGYGIHSPGGFPLAGGDPGRDLLHRRLRVRHRLHQPQVDAGRPDGPHRRPRADGHPPHLDPDRQHVGQPGPQPGHRGVPGQLGAQPAVGVPRLPGRSAASSGPASGVRSARRRTRRPRRSPRPWPRRRSGSTSSCRTGCPGTCHRTPGSRPSHLGRSVTP